MLVVFNCLLILASSISSLATGIDGGIGVGKAIGISDSKEVNHFRDQLATPIGSSGVEINGIGRSISLDALPILPFANSLEVSADVGFNLQTYKVQQDIGGNFVNYGGIKLYLNFFGNPVELDFSAEIPSISLPPPAYYGY
jgi:hypothetical protein